ncbi:MAG TPA: ABC transporter ATP-binding protein [Polaromonas sp.]|jgi:osmoprotectant transport system ATP-binding protein
MIKLEQLTKVFNTPTRQVVAADHITMEVGTGEICVLLGPSGCGKTTTLKMVNRIVTPTSGKVLIDGQDTTDMPTVELRRKIGYVIQQIGLFPNMTIEENVCVVPRLLGWDMNRARKRAAELLEMMALDPTTFLKRYPKELSGGQQQRVGVARALAADPPVMLMDEPFGAIDPINRATIQDEFLKLQKQLQKTILFVSHDIDEAVKMGSKIAIFSAGKLEQFDTPDNVLAHPAQPFIADFVGADRTLKRLGLIRVADAMAAGAPSASADTDIARAKAMMREYGADYLVVTSPGGKPEGFVHSGSDESSGGLCRDRCMRIAACVPVTADLRAAVSKMFENNVDWLACVDEEGRYVGTLDQRTVTHLLGMTYATQLEA